MRRALLLYEYDVLRPLHMDESESKRHVGTRTHGLVKANVLGRLDAYESVFDKHVQLSTQTENEEQSVTFHVVLRE
eukprot:5793765-Amphidinium_carterae.1